jgi:hypothetical protein
MYLLEKMGRTVHMIRVPAFQHLESQLQTTFLHRKAKMKGKGYEVVFIFTTFFRNSGKDFKNIAGELAKEIPCSEQR